MMKFTAAHEWLVIDGDVAKVGITKFAAEQLGDIVFVELPEAGTVLEAGAEAAVIESVKAASEVYAPAAGTVLEVNAELDENPSLVNDDPQCDGWFFRLKLDDPAVCNSLMDEDEYLEFIKKV